ncbi:MAG: endolytic transglycosylase MltG [Acidimicrobiia bacterium]
MTATDLPEPAPATRRERRPARRNTRNTTKVGIAVAVLVGLLLVPMLAAGAWVYFQLHPRGALGERVVVTVQPGWGTSQIGDELARVGVIGSGLVFRLWERDSQFTAGSYELQQNMGVVDAAAEMKSGPSAAPQVGVLPGLTLDEVGDRVAGIKRFSKDRFLDIATNGGIRSVFEPTGIQTLEGVLRPDSYPVRADQTEEGLTAAMTEAFDHHATKLGIVDAAAALGISPYEVIIVASMVQREAKLDGDRPLIAAVIYNRLKAGMPLQIDATTQYADKVGNPAYDTYTIPALPPTPISTVSASSLVAAMRPADVPFRFYVLSDANGGHVFSETYEEHLQNVDAARAKGLL